MLRLAGIIASRREGKRTVYRLTDERIHGMVEYIKSKYLENNSVEEKQL
jgi:DNA-binding transcriptional ArsR family regulator